MANVIDMFDKVLEICEKMYPDFTSGQLHFFVKVAKHENGITMQELLKLTKMSQASLSRYITNLCLRYTNDPNDTTKKIEVGPGLLEKRTDMYNQRMISVHLTPKGKELIDKIMEVLEE